MIKYSTKKTIYAFSFSLGVFLIFLALAITNLILIKISLGVAVFSLMISFIAKREMKKHFWRSRIVAEAGELETPYMFTWFWLSWVIFLFGDFVPFILYGLEIIGDKAFHKIALASLASVAILAIYTSVRYFLDIREQKHLKKKEKQLMDSFVRKEPKKNT